MAGGRAAKVADAMAASDRRARSVSLLLLLLMVAACGGTAPEPRAAAAEIAVVDAQALDRWIAGQRGKPLLVNFLATWCNPCIAELPDLVAGTREFRQRGGIVVGVAMEIVGDVTVEQAVAKVRAKAQELGLDLPLLVCSDDLLTTRQRLGVELGALPHTVGYDRSGRLLEQHEGSASAAEFAAMALATER